MDISWNSSFIDLQNLITHSRGESQKVEKYLHQFLELIPPRIEKLTESLQARDRKTIRQILHQMSPQLQFFGIPGVVAPIRRLELEYASMDYAELKSIAETIMGKLDAACEEVEKVLNTNFQQGK